MGPEALCFHVVHSCVAVCVHAYMCWCMPGWRLSPAGLPLTCSLDSVILRKQKDMIGCVRVSNTFRTLEKRLLSKNSLVLSNAQTFGYEFISFSV